MARIAGFPSISDSVFRFGIFAAFDQQHREIIMRRSRAFDGLEVDQGLGWVAGERGGQVIASHFGLWVQAERCAELFGGFGIAALMGQAEAEIVMQVIAVLMYGERALQGGAVRGFTGFPITPVVLKNTEPGQVKRGDAGVLGEEVPVGRDALGRATGGDEGTRQAKGGFGRIGKLRRSQAVVIEGQLPVFFRFVSGGKIETNGEIGGRGAQFLAKAGKLIIAIAGVYSIASLGVANLAIGGDSWGDSGNLAFGAGSEAQRGHRHGHQSRLREDQPVTACGSRARRGACRKFQNGAAAEGNRDAPGFHFGTNFRDRFRPIQMKNVDGELHPETVHRFAGIDP